MAHYTPIFNIHTSGSSVVKMLHYWLDGQQIKSHGCQPVTAEPLNKALQTSTD